MKGNLENLQMKTPSKINLDTYPNYLSLDNNVLFSQHMCHTIVSKVSPIIQLPEIGAIFEVGEMAT